MASNFFGPGSQGGGDQARSGRRGANSQRPVQYRGGRGAGDVRGTRRRGSGQSRGRGRGRDAETGRPFPSSPPSPETQECQVCERITCPTTKIVLQNDLQHYLTGNVKQKMREFMEAINGMLNETGGVVIFHAEKPEHLGHFDQKIDDKLMQMIPDGALFHDKFERYLHDNDHVVFRVKPSSKFLGNGELRPISTLDFNTKVSVNKGLADPSHAQMRSLVENAMVSQECRTVGAHSEQPPTEHSNYMQTKESKKNEIAFNYNDQVKIKRNTFEEPFQESMSVQAKAAPNPDDRKKQQLTEYCWKDAKLPDYISAFSKIPNGGSIYVGVMEEKQSTKRWVQVQEEETKTILTVHDKEYHIWKDRKGSKDKANKTMVYHVAVEGDVPDMTQEQSGKFICQGVCLTQTEKEEFCKIILEKVEKEMKWLGQSRPKNPVNIRFHGVANGLADMYVIEIRVDYFHGVSFCDLPVACRCSGPRGEMEWVTLDDWILRNGGKTAQEANDGEPYLAIHTPEF